MSRKVAREVLMKLLYERDVAGQHQEESLYSMSDEFKLEENDELYITQILMGMDKEQEKIDSFIIKYAKDWTIKRMARVDIAILRLAIYELLYRGDIPVGVSINEAVEMAKTYGNETSGSFVNGILGNFTKMEFIIDSDESEK